MSDALDRIEAALSELIGTHGDKCDKFCKTIDNGRAALAVVAELRAERAAEFRTVAVISAELSVMGTKCDQLRAQLDAHKNVLEFKYQEELRLRAQLTEAVEALKRLPNTVYVYGSYDDMCSASEPNLDEFDEVDIRAVLVKLEAQR